MLAGVFSCAGSGILNRIHGDRAHARFFPCSVRLLFLSRITKNARDNHAASLVDLHCLGNLERVVLESILKKESRFVSLGIIAITGNVCQRTNAIPTFSVSFVPHSEVIVDPPFKNNYIYHFKISFSKNLENQLNRRRKLLRSLSCALYTRICLPGYGQALGSISVLIHFHWGFHHPD